MTRFDDNLWREVERRYGSELSNADGPLSSPPRRRLPMIAGASLGVAGASAAAVVVLSAASSPPAFAVTTHRDGTVSLVIRRIDGISGANRRLAQLGIHVRAVQVDAQCQAAVAPALRHVTVAGVTRNRACRMDRQRRRWRQGQDPARADRPESHIGDRRGSQQRTGAARARSGGPGCDPRLPAAGRMGAEQGGGGPATDDFLWPSAVQAPGRRQPKDGHDGNERDHHGVAHEHHLRNGRPRQVDRARRPAHRPARRPAGRARRARRRGPRRPSSRRRSCRRASTPHDMPPSSTRFHNDQHEHAADGAHSLNDRHRTAGLRRSSV